jgi:hypothetical protein
MPAEPGGRRRPKIPTNKHLVANAIRKGKFCGRRFHPRGENSRECKVSQRVVVAPLREITAYRLPVNRLRVST